MFPSFSAKKSVGKTVAKLRKNMRIFPAPRYHMGSGRKYILNS